MNEPETTLVIAGILGVFALMIFLIVISTTTDTVSIEINVKIW